MNERTKKLHGFSGIFEIQRLKKGRHRRHVSKFVRQFNRKPYDISQVVCVNWDGTGRTFNEVVCDRYKEYFARLDRKGGAQ